MCVFFAVADGLTRLGGCGWWWCGCEASRSRSNPGSCAPPGTKPGLRLEIDQSLLSPGQTGTVRAGLKNIKINISKSSRTGVVVNHSLILSGLVDHCNNSSVSPPAQCVPQPQLPPSLGFCALGSVHSRSCQCRKWLSSPSLGSELPRRSQVSLAGSWCLQIKTKKGFCTCASIWLFAFPLVNMYLAACCQSWTWPQGGAAATWEWILSAGGTKRKETLVISHMRQLAGRYGRWVTFFHALLLLQASWMAAGSVCAERGSSWPEWSSWRRSSCSRGADRRQSPQEFSDRKKISLCVFTGIQWHEESDTKLKWNKCLNMMPVKVTQTVFDMTFSFMSDKRWLLSLWRGVWTVVSIIQ